MSTTIPGTGRFEQSFVFHMIRDFFLLLVLVAAAELAIRYVALRLDFVGKEPTRVDRAAQQLANDIRSIMLNSGGPMAAQTVYPILNRNYDDLGLSIAVVPAPVTVESMRVTFKMDVRGLQPAWPAGRHQEASATLTAQAFCLNCHVKAKVGDVLGTVTVRSYLERKEALWWEDVRLTAGALSVKILVHTILLFLLLRVRMEPLLALRSTVSGLARGLMDLSPRATVKTADEFGELAQDLNHFLDRIGGVVHDLDRILSEVVAVGTRLGALQRDLEQKVDVMHDASVRLLGDGVQRSHESQLAAARQAGAFEALDQTLEQLVEAVSDHREVPELAGTVMRGQLLRLRESFASVSGVLQSVAPPVVAGQSPAVAHQALAQSLREMALLEATMQNVASSGQQVLQRITQGRQGRLAD